MLWPDTLRLKWAKRTVYKDYTLVGKFISHRNTEFTVIHCIWARFITLREKSNKQGGTTRMSRLVPE